MHIIGNTIKGKRLIQLIDQNTVTYFFITIYVYP